ncbi:alpha/beta hydrolase, partial [Acinetobacter baumannii]
FIVKINYRKEDPNRDFTLAAVDTLDIATFRKAVKNHAARSTKFNGHALVFVHGYSVSFDDALFRCAQIAYDIGFDGPAVAFS